MMKKIMYLAIFVLISMGMASCRNTRTRNQTSETDSLWRHHLLYEGIILADRTNVDVYVRKGEKPDGVYASNGNFFWINIVDSLSYCQKRSYIVYLKEGETADYVGRYGFIVRTWDRTIRIKYIYEE